MCGCRERKATRHQYGVYRASYYIYRLVALHLHKHKHYQLLDLLVRNYTHLVLPQHREVFLRQPFTVLIVVNPFSPLTFFELLAH